MNVDLSLFGKKFEAASGILELMDDLDRALNGPERVLMLGGGNPGRLPAVEALFRAEMESILRTNDRFERLIGIYDNPQGDVEFREALASLLSGVFGRELTREHIALTSGSQQAFVLLFNALAGTFPDGHKRPLLLPITPEYIGYAETGLEADLFLSVKPRIELCGDHSFKYHVDFDALPPLREIGALCVTRPTNPSGNVLSDAELGRLAELARAADRLLIIDGAYGPPFPGIVFTPTETIWDEHIVLTLSLSKLGLPGARTGIVVARPEIARMIGRMNAVMNLSGGSLGPALALGPARDGRLLRLCDTVIKPYYQAKAETAQAELRALMDPDLPYRLHRCEGAFFLWLWNPGLPVASRELYERLKARGCLVVPGEAYFPGLPDANWRHRRECIRVSFSQKDEDVRAGLALIAAEIARAYRSG